MQFKVMAGNIYCGLLHVANKKHTFIPARKRVKVEWILSYRGTVPVQRVKNYKRLRLLRIH